MNKSEIKKAVVADLRTFAAKKKVKFIGKKTDELRAELLKFASDAKKAAPTNAAKATGKVGKKGATAPAAKGGKVNATKKAESPVKAEKKVEVKKEKAPAAPKERKVVARVMPDDAVLKELEKFDTKKGKVIHLRERGYSVNTIGIVVGMHPTNVSRYIRDAGLSTCSATVPQERKDRIKASIAAKKTRPTVEAAG